VLKEELSSMSLRMPTRPGLIVLGLVIAAGSGALHLAHAGGARGGQIQLGTTHVDFYQPGTQPEPNDLAFSPIVSSGSCSFCHGSDYLPFQHDEPHEAWVTSLMAQSARDPVWHAALEVANIDAFESGEYCIRCHAPGAWLDGRSLPPDTSGFITEGTINDWDGVNCHFCHRLVNPVLESDSPTEDASILAALADPPGNKRGNGRYVVDENDIRRGPYQDIAKNPDMNIHGVDVIYSPFHRRSEACATCHDLRNPVFKKQKDGTFALDEDGLGQPHSTQDPYDMMPEQTTYSEWERSQFARGGVMTDGRFGGNHPTGLMEECQDCHMPDTIAGGCFLWENLPWFERQDLPHHSFLGSNTWVLRAVLNLYPAESGLTFDLVENAIARTEDFLRAASDMEVVQYGDEIKVRVINYTGHKLPTGYPEGRRMWINVRFEDALGELIAEHGAYDYATAELTTSDTKVYESIHGMDSTVAGATGLVAGPSGHLALNNVIFKDNRIPPIGFSNDEYEEIGAPVVGAVYEDGQYWDTTTYPVPPEAAEVVVTLNYQPMTKEYIEFLAANAPNAGPVVHGLWADKAVGNMVPPTDMDSVTLPLISPGIDGDIVADGVVDALDFLAIVAQWGDCPPPSLCEADVNCDGTIDALDYLAVIANWTH
jgi:hypothetical protein